MLSTEKQRPKTTSRIDASSNVRLKTAATQRRSVRDIKSGIEKKAQADLLIDNDYAYQNNLRGRQLSKLGRSFKSASGNRPIEMQKVGPRPKTAPETQIPLDQDLRLPILDESEYLYLHVPDDGTDSEGEHYVTNRRPRVETKSNRGIFFI